MGDGACELAENVYVEGDALLQLRTKAGDPDIILGAEAVLKDIQKEEKILEESMMAAMKKEAGLRESIAAGIETVGKLGSKHYIVTVKTQQTSSGSGDWGGECG